MEMSTAGTVVVIVGILATAGVVAWFLLARKHPENAATHPEPGTGAAPLHGDLTGRPAGPGAEDEGVVSRGEQVPGPSAEEHPSEGR
jgi:hypothetical protein